MFKNKTIYFPAVCGSIESIFDKDLRHDISNESFRFYNKNDQFYYPRMLISAGHYYKKNIKEKWQYDLNKTVILGDSGGYQLATGVLKYNEEMVDKILQWLENNTNYALNIDFPPYIDFGSQKNENQSDWFKSRLNISYNNFKYFKEHKVGNTRLLNVLHGRSLQDLNLWYDKIKEFDFDGGWAIGSVKSMSFYYHLLNFFFLFEKGELSKLSNKGCLIHFLGFSRIKEMIYVMYLQKKLNEIDIDLNISYDSSSPLLKSKFGGFVTTISNTGVGFIQIGREILKEKEFLNKKAYLPCQCPICRGITFDKLLSYSKEQSFETMFYAYLQIHNLYKYIEYMKNAENLISLNSNTLLNDYFTNRDFTIFKIIDNAFESKNPSKYIYQNKNILDSVTLEYDDNENTSKIKSFIEY